MSVQPGPYNVVTREGLFLGRLQVEDRSLLPKQVYLGSDQGMPPEIIVESYGGNRYILKDQGAPLGLNTSRGDQDMCAFLMPEGNPPIWEITKEGDGWKISLDGKSVGKGGEGIMGQIKAVLGSSPPEIFTFQRRG